VTISVMFNAIADHPPGPTPISPPRRLRSGRLDGIRHGQADYRGAGS
jgi:cholest-4-en-3-one 26-monooxygenase